VFAHLIVEQKWPNLDMRAVGEQAWLIRWKPRAVYEGAVRAMQIGQRQSFWFQTQLGVVARDERIGQREAVFRGASDAQHWAINRHRLHQLIPALNEQPSRLVCHLGPLKPSQLTVTSCVSEQMIPCRGRINRADAGLAAPLPSKTNSCTSSTNSTCGIAWSRLKISD